MTTPGPGTINWIDLTIPDAESVRKFHADVTGWKAAPVEMGGYNDYCMMPAGAVAALFQPGED